MIAVPWGVLIDESATVASSTAATPGASWLISTLLWLNLAPPLRITAKLIEASGATSTDAFSARVPLRARPPLEAAAGCKVRFEIVESSLPPSVKTVPAAVERRTLWPVPLPMSSSLSSETWLSGPFTKVLAPRNTRSSVPLVAASLSAPARSAAATTVPLHPAGSPTQ